MSTTIGVMNGATGSVMPASWLSGTTGASSPAMFATALAQGPPALITVSVVYPPLSVRTPTTIPRRRMRPVTRSWNRNCAPRSTARL